MGRVSSLRWVKVYEDRRRIHTRCTLFVIRGSLAGNLWTQLKTPPLPTPLSPPSLTKTTTKNINNNNKHRKQQHTNKQLQQQQENKQQPQNNRNPPPSLQLQRALYGDGLLFPVAARNGRRSFQRQNSFSFMQLAARLALYKFAVLPKRPGMAGGVTASSDAFAAAVPNSKHWFTTSFLPLEEGAGKRCSECAAVQVSPSVLSPRQREGT